MNTRERLNSDLKKAQLAGDTVTRDTLRLILSALKQVEIDTRQSLDEAGVRKILAQQAKQRRESLDQYRAANREDLAAVEEVELRIISAYLPQMMTRDEVEAIAGATIAELGVTDSRGMGQVMGRLMPQLKGKADGKVVNEVVRALLAGD